jgi:uncharacterized membrane protein
MTLSTFAHQHASQLTATVGLVTYAATRKKLTPAGIASGIVVALVHMVHPWPAFFWLLMVFFLVGTGVTKVCNVFFFFWFGEGRGWFFNW